MNIDKYKTPDGDYIDKSGCYWDTPEAFMQGALLGFCCCGLPVENVKYVGSILRHIQSLDDLVPAGKMIYEEWEERGKHLGTSESLYFAYYVLDTLEFTEHGGQVPGWLTPKGFEFMEDAEKLE